MQRCVTASPREAQDPTHTRVMSRDQAYEQQARVRDHRLLLENHVAYVTVSASASARVAHAGMVTIGALERGFPWPRYLGTGAYLARNTLWLPTNSFERVTNSCMAKFYRGRQKHVAILAHFARGPNSDTYTIQTDTHQLRHERIDEKKYPL